MPDSCLVQSPFLQMSSIYRSTTRFVVFLGRSLRPRQALAPRLSRTFGVDADARASILKDINPAAAAVTVEQKNDVSDPVLLSNTAVRREAGSTAKDPAMH